MSDMTMSDMLARVQRDPEWAAAELHECHQGSIGVHGLHRIGFERRTKLSEVDLVKRTLAAVVKEMK